MPGMSPLSIPVDIVHIIQLAVAPVFLIAGIGALLNVMTQRLARVIDRGRALEDQIAAEEEGEPRRRHVDELLALDRRMRRINYAISLSTLAALLVCAVIMMLFASELMGMEISRPIAMLFIGAMGALIAALVLFLMEISIAIKTIRVNKDLLIRQS